MRSSTVAPHLRAAGAPHFPGRSAASASRLRLDVPPRWTAQRRLAHACRSRLFKLDGLAHDGRCCATPPTKSSRERRQLNAAVARRIRSRTCRTGPPCSTTSSSASMPVRRRVDRHCAVLFLNVDRFKQINDSLGYAAGDEVLTLLANRLRSMSRQRRAHALRGAPGEPIAARLGGDEFVVVLDDLAHADDVHIVALATGERPRAAVRRAVRTSSQCTVSMGIVLRRAVRRATPTTSCATPASRWSKPSAPAAARCAVFHAGDARTRGATPGHGGSSCASRWRSGNCSSSTSRSSASWTARTESAGRPHAPASKRSCAGAIRPRGIVPPLDFIGVAEECGLIGALGQYVLEEACHQFVAWREMLGDLAPRLLAVNLSRGQLEAARIRRRRCPTCCGAAACAVKTLGDRAPRP